MKITQKKIDCINALKANGIDFSKDACSLSTREDGLIKDLTKGIKFTPSKTSWFGRTHQLYNHLQRINNILNK